MPHSKKRQSRSVFICVHLWLILEALEPAFAFCSLASQPYTFRSRNDRTPIVMATLVRKPRLTGQYNSTLGSRMARTRFARWLPGRRVPLKVPPVS